MDAEISTTPSSGVHDAERALKDAASALEGAESATRAAETALLERRAEQAEARATYDRATERITEVYQEERRRLEEASRIADAALKELEDKLQSLRPGDTAPGSRTLEAVPEPAPIETDAETEAETVAETVDLAPAADGDGGEAEDWLAQLQQESERERRTAGDA
jgi:hypothetical protein